MSHCISDEEKKNGITFSPWNFIQTTYHIDVFFYNAILNQTDKPYIPRGTDQGDIL